MMPERASEYRFDVLGWLIWAFVPVSVTYIFSTLLTARERMMRMNRFFVVGIALDLVLNLALIPQWQAVGSAIAALATQVFIAAAMIWLCVREFEFRPSRLGLVQTFGFLGFILVFDWFLFEQTSLAWPPKFALALGAGLAGLFLFKMVGWASLKTLRNG
jgi:O-antigen/teichoic acid export membrane protein